MRVVSSFFNRGVSKELSSLGSPMHNARVFQRDCFVCFVIFGAVDSGPGTTPWLLKPEFPKRICPRAQDGQNTRLE
jgi:hypothetical protein